MNRRTVIRDFSFLISLAAFEPILSSSKVFSRLVSPPHLPIEDTLRDLLSYVILAPSGHNVQPWLFEVGKSSLVLRPDLSRRLPAADPNDRELWISLGCAVENLLLAAPHFGYQVAIVAVDKVAGVSFSLRGADNAENSTLLETIKRRQSNRFPYKGSEIPSSLRNKLSTTEMIEGVSLALLDDASTLRSLQSLYAEANRAQMEDDAWTEELIYWLRFNKDEMEEKRDGIATICVGSPSSPRWLGSFFVRTFSSASKQTEKDMENLLSSAGLAVFTTKDDTFESWLTAGRSVQRFLLRATEVGLATAFLQQPVQISHTRKELPSVLSLRTGLPQLMVRYGYAEPAPYSLRRPVGGVLA